MHLRRHRAKAKHVYACILRMIERAHGDADSRSSSMQKKKKSVPALTAVHCMQGEAGGVAFAYGSEQERRGEERDGRVTTGGEEGKRDAGWPRCRGRCAISFLYLLPPLPYNKARGASLIPIYRVLCLPRPHLVSLQLPTVFPRNLLASPFHTPIVVVLFLLPRSLDLHLSQLVGGVRAICSSVEVVSWIYLSISASAFPSSLRLV